MKVSGIATQIGAGSSPSGTDGSNAAGDGFGAALQSATAPSAATSGAGPRGADAGAGAAQPEPPPSATAKTRDAVGDAAQDRADAATASTAASDAHGDKLDAESQAARAELIAALLGVATQTSAAAANAGRVVAAPGNGLPAATPRSAQVDGGAGLALAATGLQAARPTGPMAWIAAKDAASSMTTGDGKGETKGGLLQAVTHDVVAGDAQARAPQAQAVHAGSDHAASGTAALGALLHAGDSTGRAPSTAPVPAQHQSALAQQTGSPGWGEALGAELAWMAGKDIGSARLRLHPENLGSMDVNIQVQHGRVDVAFVVQHPAAAAAVQDALAQLGSQLGQHGLSLGDTSVAQQQRQGGDGSAATARRGDAADDALPPSGITLTHATQRGLLDTFA